MKYRLFAFGLMVAAMPAFGQTGSIAGGVKDPIGRIGANVASRKCDGNT